MYCIYIYVHKKASWGFHFCSISRSFCKNLNLKYLSKFLCRLEYFEGQCMFCLKITPTDFTANLFSKILTKLLH